MLHETLKPVAPVSGIAMAAILADPMTIAGSVEAALDARYGRGQWFLSWEEDLRGRPIPGTITLAFDQQTLVVG